MKSIKDFINEEMINESKDPVVGKKYKADDGKMWKVVEFESVDMGQFAEEGHNYIIDEYNDGNYGRIVDGDYDNYEGYVVGCVNGRERKAFLWDEKAPELYSFD